MQHVQSIALICLVNLIIYYRTLFYGYVGDDVERSQRQVEFKNKWHKFWLQYVGLKHINSMHSHLMTLLTHTTLCCLIYLVLGMNSVSLLTALLFSVNPVNIQGSIWISGRNYVVSAILTLLMFVFPYLSIIPYYFTSFFAVNAWFAPLAFIGTKYWYMVGIMPLVWLLTKHNRKTLYRKLWETGGVQTTNSEMRAVKIQKIIPFLKCYAYYFILCVIPFNIGIDHNFLRGFGTNKTDNEVGYRIDKWFWIGLWLFGTVNMLFLGCMIWGWLPSVWGLLWFTVNIAMWCNFVTYQQQIAERYCYLANIGLMFTLANIIVGYPVVIAMFLTGYLVRLRYLMPMYINDWWAVEYTIREFKTLSYMWLVRGVRKFVDKDYVGAYRDFSEAYTHKPYDFKVLYNMAVVSFLLGNVEQARKFVEDVKKNRYDESEKEANVIIEKLEKVCKVVEEAKAQGKSEVKVDLKEILIVK